MRYSVMIALLLSLMGITSLGFAQDFSGLKGIELKEVMIESERQLITRDVMELTEAENDAFWETYHVYRDHMVHINDRKIVLLKKFAKEYKKMDEDRAQAILDEYFAIEKDLLAIKKEFMPLFAKAVPKEKVLRFYQVQNKIDAIVDKRISESIPVVGIDQTLKERITGEK